MVTRTVHSLGTGRYIYDFLVGFSVEFEVVRVWILGKQDMSSLNETISIISRQRNNKVLYLRTMKKMDFPF